ncbi:flagellar biosynthetic protein FliO [Planctomycetota bacterium]|nr:flagellar biosynthetic protein FliO [Planctomycetota bacterium]
MPNRLAHTSILILAFILTPILCAQSDSGANQTLSLQPEELQEPTFTKPDIGDIQVDFAPVDSPTRSRIQTIADNFPQNPESPTISPTQLPTTPILQPTTVTADIDPTTDEAAVEPTTKKANPNLAKRHINSPPPTQTGNEDQAFNPATNSYIYQTLIALGIVISLMFFLKWLYSKLTGQVSVNSASVVQVLARTSIAPRNHILVLRIGSRILICSDSSNGTRTLSEITDPEEVAEMLAHTSAAKDNSLSKSFNNMLGRYGADYDKQGRHPDEGLDTVEFQSDSARESVSKLLSKVRDMAGKGGSR